MQDAVGPGELADLVQQAGRVDESCSLSSHPTRPPVPSRSGPPRLRDGRRPIAQPSALTSVLSTPSCRPTQLDRARFELLGAVLRAQQRDRQVPEDQKQHDRGEQGEARHSHTRREDRRQRAGGELAGEHREVVAHLALQRLAFPNEEVQAVQQQVEYGEHDERAEDDQAEDDALRHVVDGCVIEVAHQRAYDQAHREGGDGMCREVVQPLAR